MRNICVFTGDRADYGLLRPVMQRIAHAEEMDLQLLVGGGHLSQVHGSTVREIEGDGLAIDGWVKTLGDGDGDSPLDICGAMARGLEGAASELDRLAPDLLVLLGDRYETFCAAAAATVLGIPIAHIHGGESTFGAFDEALRHAITKMAHLHFTSTEAYRRRVIQLGEDAAHVFHVGALGVENARSLDLPSAADVGRSIGFPLTEPFLLGTLHPVTLRLGTAARDAAATLEALERLGGPRALFTMANADPEGRAINRALERYAEAHPDRFALVPSLGVERYLGAVQGAAAVVGNSSSGLLEAPAFRTPSVDVGERQAGRVRPSSVIHCDPEPGAIADAIRRATDPAFRASLAGTVNPYEADGVPSETICEVLRSADLEGIREKRFCDLALDA